MSGSEIQGNATLVFIYTKQQCPTWEDVGESQIPIKILVPIDC